MPGTILKAKSQCRWERHTPKPYFFLLRANLFKLFTSFLDAKQTWLNHFSMVIWREGVGLKNVLIFGNKTSSNLSRQDNIKVWILSMYAISSPSWKFSLHLSHCIILLLSHIAILTCVLKRKDKGADMNKKGFRSYPHLLVYQVASLVWISLWHTKITSS